MVDGEAGTLSLIQNIYEGLLDFDGLPVLAERLVRLGKGHTGGLCIRSSMEKVALYSKMEFNTDRESAKAWAENFANISPMLPVERMAKSGDVITASHLVSTESYKRSIYYNEWARKRSHFDYIGIVLKQQKRTMDYFAILRPHSAGLVTESEVEQMKIIANHFRRAYMLSTLLNKYRIEAAALGSVIENAGFGVVLAAPDGEIVYANNVAEMLIRLRRGLYARQGRIASTDAKTNQKLQMLICAVSHPIDGIPSGGSLILPNQNGESLFSLHVVPVSRQSSSNLIFSERPVAGLFIVERNLGAAERVKSFAQLFGLTPAEMRMLAALIFGEGVTCAAERLKMAESTARTHIRHILEKTDTHRQAELTRLFFEVTIPSTIGMKRFDRDDTPIIPCFT
jgi:DNA-binding CsgD family transcriptional regulator